jgi:hypothetical protein
MRNVIRILSFGLLVGACAVEGDDDATASEFRSAPVIDVSIPAGNAPVVATLIPGAPFKFGDRYAYVKAPNVGPNMARFTPANVGTIPTLDSGDIIAVKRGNQTSRARIVGWSDEGGIVFRPQAGSPFTHAFSAVPWASWGAAAGAVQGCASAVADEWFDCLETVGEGSWCSNAADDELDECASGQNNAIAPDFGGIHHAEFECLIPFPHSITHMGTDMSMGGCGGSFWGTSTQEPGFMGCEDVYNGTWHADDGDCMDGPADVIVLANQPV